MSRFKSLYLGAIYTIFVIAISSGGASAQQADWNPHFSSEATSNYDGSFIKVGHKGRRNTALAIGAIVLGTMLYNQNQNRSRNYQGNYAGDRHTNWCHNRYRSYRAYDNTFQPYNGRRRECISPYY
jgi:BA14K-like protein